MLNDADNGRSDFNHVLTCIGGLHKHFLSCYTVHKLLDFNNLILANGTPT